MVYEQGKSNWSNTSVMMFHQNKMKKYETFFFLFLFNLCILHVVIRTEPDLISGYSESEGKEAGAQQIPQCSQVGDGVIIRIQTMSPDQPHQHVCHIQQY